VQMPSFSFLDMALVGLVAASLAALVMLALD
jgi:hypothetical protein